MRIYVGTKQYFKLITKQDLIHDCELTLNITLNFQLQHKNINWYSNNKNLNSLIFNLKYNFLDFNCYLLNFKNKFLIFK